MWEQTELENHLKEALEQELAHAKAEEIYSQYVLARKQLVEEVLEDIKGMVPELTDHGPRHILNVLSNAHEILGEQLSSLHSIEVYILCVSILFHDVGNLFGRKKHNKNISKIFSHIRGDAPGTRAEQSAVLAIAGAHTGCASGGSKDTLAELNNNLAVLGKSIKAQKIAAVLRFADELAEGTHRTSAFMQNHKMYPKESEIYHAYASITDHCIDKDNARIAITYNINLKTADGELTVNGIELSEMLKFIYSRVVKLDQERRYTKHYCSWLDNFKHTSATLEFWHEDEPLELNLEPIVLSDLIVPGETTRGIAELNANYDIPSLIEQIKQLFSNEGD